MRLTAGKVLLAQSLLASESGLPIEEGAPYLGLRGDTLK